MQMSSLTSYQANQQQCRSLRIRYVGCALLLAILVVVALCVGRYAISPVEVMQTFFEPWLGLDAPSRVAENVIWQTRLPRILLAIIAGSGLALAGASFQALLANPLASPDTLGVATGASFGAVLGMLFGGSLWVMQGLSLVSGIVAMGLVLWLSQTRTSRSVLMIVLAGLIVSALFTALVALIKLVADPQDVLPQITFWLMGSLASAQYRMLWLGLPLTVVCASVLLLLRWRLNITTLSPEEAQALGIPLRRLQGLVILCATGLTAAIVSMVGLIGWVGLLVPHVARLLFGTNQAVVLPASLWIGAILLLLVDTVSRTIFPVEVPVSILTALLGAPFFMLLLRRTQGAA